MKPFQKVTLDIVPKLKEALKNDVPASIVPLQMVDMYVKCKRILPDVQVNLYVPGGAVDRYGTFILYVPEHRGNFVVHSTSPDLVGIKKGILELQDINWKKVISFGPIDIRFHDIIHEIMDIKDIFTGNCQVSESLGMTREEALHLAIEVPDDLELKKLDISYSDFINSRWPHGVPSSLSYIQDTLKLNGGVGLFLKGAKEPVSWAVFCMIGGVGMIQTLEQYRGRRYADVVAKAVTRMVAEEGFDPQVQINLGLDASKRLFTKMGYSVTHQLTWHLCNR